MYHKQRVQQDKSPPQWRQNHQVMFWGILLELKKAWFPSWTSHWIISELNLQILCASAVPTAKEINKYRNKTASNSATLYLKSTLLTGKGISPWRGASCSSSKQHLCSYHSSIHTVLQLLLSLSVSQNRLWTSGGKALLSYLSLRSQHLAAPSEEQRLANSSGDKYLHP